MDVAVLSADPIRRSGAISFLGLRPEINVIADQDSANADVLVLIEDAVTDAAITRLRGVHAGRSRTTRPHCVVVTDGFSEDCILAAVECGVVAVLPTAQINSTLLVASVQNAKDGTVHLPLRLQGALVTRLHQMRRDVLEPRGLGMSGLALREQDVLQLVAKGFGTKEIATKLAYSERTVKNVLYGVMTRCGLKNRSHAVAYAVRSGAI